MRAIQFFSQFFRNLLGVLRWSFCRVVPGLCKYVATRVWENYGRIIALRILCWWYDVMGGYYVYHAAFHGRDVTSLINAICAIEGTETHCSDFYAALSTPDIECPSVLKLILRETYSVPWWRAGCGMARYRKIDVDLDSEIDLVGGRPIGNFLEWRERQFADCESY